MKCEICDSEHDGNRRICTKCRNKKTHKYCRSCGEYKLKDGFEIYEDGRTVCSACFKGPKGDDISLINWYKLSARSEWLLRIWNDDDFIKAALSHYENHDTVPFCWKVLASESVVARCKEISKDKAKRSKPTREQAFRIGEV